MNSLMLSIVRAPSSGERSHGPPHATSCAARSANSALNDRCRSWESGVFACVLATTLNSATPAFAAVESFTSLTPDTYLADIAKIVPSGARGDVEARLRDLQRDTGYRVRIITKPELNKGELDQARRVWGVDKRTIILLFDPTAPNIFGYDYIGDDVLFNALRRPFWIELQSRYGNLFFVREQGEGAAVTGVVGAVDTCLRREGGCRVVPGLPEEQYYFTLVTSVAGGLIFGFASRLPTDERVRRQWVWTLLFAPLWGTLFFSFGLGPIVSRTDDKLGLFLNLGAFLIAALLFRPAPLFFDEQKK